MGGTRCIFRKCKKSHNNSPNLHFFHFPSKKPNLLHEWVKMAKTAYILDMPESQQRNKSICMLHFRDECFMNYVKNRLVPDAVPTLDRLANGMVLDYSKSDNPTPCTLPPPTQAHLIPPEGYKVCKFATIPSTVVLPPTNPQKKRIHSLKESETKKIRLDENSIGSPKILNKLSCQKVQTAITNVLEASNDEGNQDIIELDEANDDENLDFLECGYTEKSTDSSLNNQIKFSIEPLIINNKSSIEIVPVEVERIQQKSSENTASIAEAYALIVQLEEDLETMKNKAETAEERALTAERLANQLKNEHNDVQQNSAVSTSKEQPMFSQPQANQLSKAQLFNAVKKYLNSSITALVRMEMFGNSERSWKPDEKEVSMDILRLGENVYNYFTDEWRFRLPSKKLVEEWIREAPNAIVDDDSDL